MRALLWGFGWGAGAGQRAQYQTGSLGLDSRAELTETHSCRSIMCRANSLNDGIFAHSRWVPRFATMGGGAVATSSSERTRRPYKGRNGREE